ncbi:MAG TPA: hypothetical protein VK539_08345 [Myxococcaceae bacterium]|nr:hypothetical protein [Myxococcaceae bacterium]
MPYSIHIPNMLFSMMEELPRRTCASIHLTLSRMAELAPEWPLDDPRWERLARRDAEGLHFYVDGCCVRLELEAATQCLSVREIGRVLVHLPAGLLNLESTSVASAVEQ